MQITPIKTRVFLEDEDLLSFIFKYLNSLKENSILVVTSKIVALSEGRTVDLLNEKEKVRFIKRESKGGQLAIKTKFVWLTIKDHIVMANAGIDESNGNGKLILLPKNSFQTAKIISEQLKKHFKIKNLGVIISDSGLLPLRSGVVGVAVGYAGFEGVKSYKNKKDIFGRKFIYQKTNVADSLATSATLCMGEGSEQQPLAVITDAPVTFTKKINKKEIIMNSKEDIYAPLFNKIN